MEPGHSDVTFVEATGDGLGPAPHRAIYVASPDGPLRQGEILSDVIQLRLKLSSDGAEIPEAVEFQKVLHQFAVVVSQDCELDWDYKVRNHIQVNGKDVPPDKILPNVMFGRVNSAKGMRGNVAGNIWRKIQQNKDERYHFLEMVPAECDHLQTGLPEMGIDFKYYFTIPTDEVYARIKIGEAKRRCILSDPYLQHLSSRFFYFQGRVALPREHESEPVS